MKRNMLILIVAGLMAVQATAPDPNKPIAVVELFTSQGCSSCPPADRLLTEVSQAATAKGEAVYALSFHVDYWDRLGWRDPYSNHAYTVRQYQYARQFKLESVYTPQAVLNGKNEFVGSNRARLTALVADALHQPAPVEVQLSANRTGQTITVTYKLAGPLPGTVLNVALVSEHVSTEVKRGENAGRTLTHNNVVRTFTMVKATPDGQITLAIPADFNPAEGAIIGYVQQENTLATLGATRVGFDQIGKLKP